MDYLAEARKFGGTPVPQEPQGIDYLSAAKEFGGTPIQPEKQINYLEAAKEFGGAPVEKTDTQPNPFLEEAKKQTPTPEEKTKEEGRWYDFLTQETKARHELAKKVGEDVFVATKNTPVQAKAAVAAALEGNDPAVIFGEKDWKDSTIQEARKAAKAERGFEGAEEEYLLGITREKLRNLPQNLSFSLVSMGAGLVAGIPAAIGTTPLGGLAAGAGASGLAAYRMDTNMFLRDLRDHLDAASEKTTGKPLTDEQFIKVAKSYESKVHEHGLWEALPEAISNAIGFKLGAALFKEAAPGIKGLLVDTVNVGRQFVNELATETVTQTGQHNVEVDSGMSNEPKRSFADIDDLKKSAQEVLPDVLLLTGVTTGGAKAAGMAYRGTEFAKNREIARAIEEDVASKSFTPEGIQEEAARRMAGAAPVDIPAIARAMEQPPAPPVAPPEQPEAPAEPAVTEAGPSPTTFSEENLVAMGIGKTNKKIRTQLIGKDLNDPEQREEIRTTLEAYSKNPKLSEGIRTRVTDFLNSPTMTGEITAVTPGTIDQALAEPRLEPMQVSSLEGDFAEVEEDVMKAYASGRGALIQTPVGELSIVALEDPNDNGELFVHNDMGEVVGSVFFSKYEAPDGTLFEPQFNIEESYRSREFDADIYALLDSLGAAYPKPEEVITAEPTEAPKAEALKQKIESQEDIDSAVSQYAQELYASGEYDVSAYDKAEAELVSYLQSNGITDKKALKQARELFSEKLVDLDSQGGPSFANIAAVNPSVATETTKRSPSFKREVKKINKLLRDGFMTEEQHTAAITQTVENDVAQQKKSQKARGAMEIKQRLSEAAKNDILSTEDIELAEWFIRQNYNLFDDLGISIRQPTKYERGVSGSYDPFTRVSTLLKRPDISGTTIIHEFMHHMERMMPVEVQGEITKAWIKSFASAMKKADKGTDQDLKNFFQLLYNYHFIEDLSSNQQMRAALKMIKDGKVDYEFYQYVNPSEFWAVNATRIVENRYNFSEGTINKLKKWLSELAEKLKSVVGLPSDAPLIRALDSLAKADGKFKSQAMLSQTDTYFSLGPNQRQPTQQAKDALDEMQRLGLGERPQAPGMFATASSYVTDAINNPSASIESAKQTYKRWIDGIGTQVFASDRALNNNIQRAIREAGLGKEEIIGYALNISLSQTNHADAVATNHILYGNSKWNEDLLKWEAVYDEDAKLSTLARQTEEMANAQGMSFEQAKLIAHRAFEARRLQGLQNLNEQIREEMRDKYAQNNVREANRLRRKLKFIHMNQEQINFGLDLFNQFPELAGIDATWNKMRGNAAKVMVDTGLWTEEEANDLLAVSDYVPFRRDREAEADTNPQGFPAWPASPSKREAPEGIGVTGHKYLRQHGDVDAVRH
jgi:hypothetical protein